jgi:UDP-N-acetylmuramoyl-L-alanyl-D-glutamate--2,6-diaminopimelate ligase
MSSSLAAPLRPAHVAAHPLPGLATHLGLSRPDAAADVAVTGVTHASGEVRPGDLYVAMPGRRTHGARFAAAAVEQGAVALLTDPTGAEIAAGTGVPALVCDDPRSLLGAAAAWVYDHPAEALTVYGVTGTNGKTTVTTLLHAVLSVDGPAGLVGTIETRVGAAVVPSVRTTPEASDLQALLAVMRESGVHSVALEVSSHALVLGRVGGLVVDVAGFTNLSQDHLDFHGDMHSYYEAKASLFTPQRSRRGVVVVDDAWGRRLVAEATVPVTTVAVLPDDPHHRLVQAADWRADAVRAHGAGSVVTVHGPGDAVLDVSVGMPGPVNVVNGVLTVAMAVAGGIDPGRAARALAEAPAVPGRMEVVSAADPLVVVDYAHTPDSVHSALATLRATAPGPLVVVLGAGGDRDTTKRGPMGAAAAQGADLVVVTDDNPRSEDPGAIRAAVRDGAAEVDPARVLEVPDRGAAIRVAIDRAGSGSVLVAGKGHEQGQEVGGTVHPFDDRMAVRAVLAERREAS